MIIRKPYAFMIKHFRLVHVILSALILGLVYGTINILNFFNDYLNGFAQTIEPGIAESLFNGVNIIISIIIILFAITSFILMRYKQKPSKLYFYIAIGFIGYLVYYLLAYSTVKSLEVALVNIKTLKIYRDLSIIFLFNHILTTLFTIIRATGFDIKSFDFKSMLDELDVETDDQEEVEINVEFDTDKVKRNVKRNLRHIQYVYVENKGVIISLILIFIVLVSGYIYLNKNVFNKKYSLNETIVLDNYSFEIVDSYVTNKNFLDENIYDKKALVVIRTKIKTNKEETLDLGNMYLNVSKKNYHTKNIEVSSVNDIGERYIEQILSNEYKTYLFIFEIPYSQIKKEMTLYYNTKDDKKVAIDVTPQLLDNASSEKRELNIGEKLFFENSVLKNSTLTIDSYSIEDGYTINYKKNIQGEEFNYKEYIKPSTIRNVDTTILKITGEFKLDDNLKYGNILDIYDLIKYYGEIIYIKNNSQKSAGKGFEFIKAEHKEENDYYIEVNKDIKDADNIYLLLSIRNKKYIYHLK